MRECDACAALTLLSRHHEGYDFTLSFGTVTVKKCKPESYATRANGSKIRTLFSFQNVCAKINSFIF